jgi:hypothetical protein
LHSKRIARRVILVLATSWLLLPAQQANAADGTIEIRESTFNELAKKLEPIRFKSPRDGAPHPVKILGVGCEGHWTAEVTGTTFKITGDTGTEPGKITVTGKINAIWTCGGHIPIPATFTTNAHAIYDENGRQVRINVDPIRVTLNFGLFSRTIDVAEGLDLPTIPVTATALFFEAEDGPQMLRLQPYHVQVNERNGFLELQADVQLW